MNSLRALEPRPAAHEEVISRRSVRWRAEQSTVGTGPIERGEGRSGWRVGLASSAFQFNVEWQMEFFMTCSKSEISQLVDKVRKRQ